MVGAFLPGLAALAARQLASQIPQIQDGPYAEGDIDLLLEIIAFYMHLANRIGFRELGAERCARFSHRLVVAVGIDVATSLNKGLSSVQVVAELRDKYNEREEYYARYKQFLPEADQPTKNTLFHEFTKVIFNRFVRSNDTFDLLLVEGLLSPEIAFFLKETNDVMKR